MLRQVGAGERLTDAVVADVGDLAQAVEQAERLQDAGINADADVGVPASTLCSVERDVKARSATTAIGSRRRRRASWMSAPSLRSARRTAAGGLCGVAILTPSHYRSTKYVARRFTTTPRPLRASPQ